MQKSEKVEPRICEKCGKEFWRRLYLDGQKERWGRYLKRPYCSDKCFGRKERGTIEWKPSNPKRFCQNCGDLIMWGYDADGICFFGKWLYCYKSLCQDAWRYLNETYYVGAIEENHVFNAISEGAVRKSKKGWG